jgi:hypothetical protein
MNFDKKLRAIISQGDTSKEYRNLFKKILKIHREEFTEENLPTTEDYLKELLKDAIQEVADREHTIHKFTF